VLDADIEACFDSIAHAALLEQMRRRVGDKRVLALVKAFLKAGIMSADGQITDTNTGTPQGALCSAEHNAPYEQCRVMRSAGPLALVTATPGLEHFA
jgi:retron-type reverse transcriptase